jgi:hypothetical protein
MALSVWTQPSGYSFTAINEREITNIPLPVENSAGITFKVITGKLPPGLRLDGTNIVGSAYEVPRSTEFQFCIRATGTTGFSDRTYNITVNGADEPVWLQPTGLLPIGTNDAYYILDTSFVDFQLNAIDTDTTAGQTIKFFIASDDGELPPGLILTEDGRITGFIQPVLQIPLNAGNGNYDEDLYDSVAYDYGYRSSNGYDTYVYDLTVYDFSVDSAFPRKLNRNYEFIVTITDGDTVTTRKFRIYVVGDDFFRADNVITKAGTGVYTADITYVRAPIWTTPNNLGTRRANNYQTFKLDIFQGFTELGPVVYQLDSVNAVMNGLAQRENATDNREGSTIIRMDRINGVPEVGYQISLLNAVVGAGEQVYTITDVEPLGTDLYRMTVTPSLIITIPNGSTVYIGTESILPPGMQFDATTSEVFGVVPYQPAITSSYDFTVSAIRFGEGSETSMSKRVFHVNILGEVESAMQWISPTDLGTISANYVSTLKVQAASSITKDAILYTVESGSLPTGLNLNLDGEIIGKPTQFNTEGEYQSLWNSFRSYKVKDIIKTNNLYNIIGVSRTRNISTLVTEETHNLATGEFVKIASNQSSFNYDSVKIKSDLVAISSYTSKTQTGETEDDYKWQVTFAIPSQTLTPLAPTYINITGTSVTASATYQNVTVDETSGNGLGAIFTVVKGGSGTVYNAVTTIKLTDAGSGYRAKDTITIYGSQLGGVDGVNDLTFTISNGLEVYYQIKGNSNSNYNGTFLATASTKTSITLCFDTDPGTYGVGLISTVNVDGSYQGNTYLKPANFFSYTNKGTSYNSLIAATGTLEAKPSYYRANTAHDSGGSINYDFWDSYKITDLPGGLIKFVSTQGDVTFDNKETTIDREYTFEIRARDPLGYSAINQTFTLTVDAPDQIQYSNIYAKPLLAPAKRRSFIDFVNDSAIFDPRLIYRPNDSNFGIQRDLRMLVYAGIETKDAIDYISAIGRNHKSKRFIAGNVKTAVAKIPGTNTVVYEVVYLEIIDPLESNGKHINYLTKHSSNPLKVTIDQTNQFYEGPFDVDTQFWRRPIPFHSTTDRNDVFAGDAGTAWKFVSSITNWRNRLAEVGVDERQYLPLWMRTIQPGNTVELDYVSAVPLCYCIPGTSADIILNIKNSSFDFKALDITVDRYIIDSITGDNTDKYLVFRNDRTTIT